MADNIINAVFGSGLCAVTTSAFRANYGMVLRFSGIDLPTAFEVDFSNYDVSGKDSVTAIGQNNEVQIPDDLWDSGLNIYAYVYLHPTDDSGVTVYTVTIPVLGRPNRTEETPTPHEQSVIEQAISALNDAVEQTAADVVATDASASAAAQSEANAATSERAAAASAGAALASQNAAESASQSATESASASAESARNAALSASQAAQSATDAQEYAEQAERSVQSISGDVERAESAAATATDKAAQSEQSATAAAQSAQSAASSAQNAASSSTAAESSATDAEQAKTDAQAAQVAAEQAAESVSGLSAQITQNTADIAELVLSKAGALIDTATGSIASFVPDATVPTVHGLTVDIEPVQDLHGYDSPWPAGGGTNKWDEDWEAGRLSWTGENYADSTKIRSKGFIPVIAGETYRIVTSSNIQIFYYNSDKEFVSYESSSKANQTTITIPTGCEYLRFYTYGTDYGTVYKHDIAINYPSTVTTYSPYSNICPISGWDAIEVQRTAINVWDEEWELGGISSANGSKYNDSNRIRSKNYISVKPSTRYYFAMPSAYSHFKVVFYRQDKTFLSYSAYKNSAFTTPSDCYWLMISENATDYGVTYNNDISINYPANDTEYHPYQGDTYQIQVGQTVYGGTLDVTNGVLTVDRAMVDLGTLTWSKLNTSTGHWRFITKDIPIKWNENNSSVGNMLCSVYPAVSANDTYLGITGVSSHANVTQLLVCDESYTDAAAFKTAMSGVQLCYELATPITYQLTPQEVSTIVGLNNIWADTGDVSVDYAADLKHYIDTKIAAAVAALS